MLVWGSFECVWVFFFWCFCGLVGIVWFILLGDLDSALAFVFLMVFVFFVIFVGFGFVVLIFWCDFLDGLDLALNWLGVFGCFCC